jgi:hypothetical protein
MQSAFVVPTSGEIAIPSSLAWYCNANHVKAADYQVPVQATRKEAKLVHVVYVQRHHKRAPDNLIPNDEKDFNSAEGWKCVSRLNQLSIERGLVFTSTDIAIAGSHSALQL